MGFDIFIDEDLKYVHRAVDRVACLTPAFTTQLLDYRPWVIEVNIAPSFKVSFLSHLLAPRIPR